MMYSLLQALLFETCWEGFVSYKETSVTFQSLPNDPRLCRLSLPMSHILYWVLNLAISLCCLASKNDVTTTQNMVEPLVSWGIHFEELCLELLLLLFLFVYILTKLIKHIIVSWSKEVLISVILNLKILNFMLSQKLITLSSSILHMGYYCIYLQCNFFVII